MTSLVINIVQEVNKESKINETMDLPILVENFYGTWHSRLVGFKGRTAKFVMVLDHTHC